MSLDCALTINNLPKFNARTVLYDFAIINDKMAAVSTAFQKKNVGVSAKSSFFMNTA